LLILARRPKFWWLLLLLLIVSPAAIGQATALRLVGTWKGSVPAMVAGSCSNETIKVSITKQCRNLFRGRLSFAGTSFNFVGRIQNATNINIHGQTASSYISIYGYYQAGSPAKIIVNYLYTRDPQSMYDTFPASYAGPGGIAAFELLLLK